MKKILLTIFIITISTQIVTAQNMKRANNLFERRAYIAAEKLYEQEDPKTQEVYEKLGDCYYFTSNMKQAALNYKILVDNYNENLNPNYIYKYTQALKGIGNFEEADKWLQKYNLAKDKNNGKTVNTKAYFEKLNNAIDRPYIVKKVSLNSEKSNFGTSYYGDKIVFSSPSNNGKLYDWNNKPYLDLYITEQTTSGDLKNIQQFSENINSKMHESNAVFTKDGKTMYFTRNNYINGKKGKDNKKITHLKIYKAELVNEIWTNITELPFNSNNYSCEHPALSTDEKKLYFASDMPGSIGSFDLFKVNINSNGTYGKPENLGDKINTEQREQFPFISSKNILYFASDGHFGLGGLDIFKSEIKSNTYTQPTNLSNVINSNLDDFSFIINEEKETGYFSSNRNNTLGIDNIYSFTQLKKYYIKGVVKNKTTGELITGANVALLDVNNNTVSEVMVGNNAEYSFEINKNSNYTIRSSKKYFSPYSAKISSDETEKINKDILLESYEATEKKVVKENGQIKIKINPIYFDFNKWNIRKDAALELNGIVETMKKFPEMVIEIGAHTDCIGPEKYNLELSNKRANSVRKYLISQGISNKNVKAVGYGESQPLNHCIKEGICEDKDYDINRRCEFIILN